MAKRTQHTIGLDIGTSKVTCIAGEPGEGGLLEVVGIGEAEARGLRKGVIVNPDAAVDAIKKAVEEAERMSGLEAEEVTINLAGSHILGFNGQAIVAVSGRDREIVAEDVRRAEGRQHLRAQRRGAHEERRAAGHHRHLPLRGRHVRRVARPTRLHRGLDAAPAADSAAHPSPDTPAGGDSDPDADTRAHADSNAEVDPDNPPDPDVDPHSDNRAERRRERRADRLHGAIRRTIGIAQRGAVGCRHGGAHRPLRELRERGQGLGRCGADPCD